MANVPPSAAVAQGLKAGPPLTLGDKQAPRSAANGCVVPTGARSATEGPALHRRRSLQSGTSSSQAGFARDIEHDFLGASPPLDLLFTGDRRANVGSRLDIHQAIDTIARRALHFAVCGV
jgi:hypothetical protein